MLCFVCLNKMKWNQSLKTPALITSEVSTSMHLVIQKSQEHIFSMITQYNPKYKPFICFPILMELLVCIWPIQWIYFYTRIHNFSENNWNKVKHLLNVCPPAELCCLKTSGVCAGKKNKKSLYHFYDVVFH